MRAICFIQEVKGGDLTMRQQILICVKPYASYVGLAYRSCTLRQEPKNNRLRCALAWPTCCAPRQTEKRMS